MTMAGVTARGGGITGMIATTGAGATGTIGVGTMIVTIGVDQRRKGWLRAALPRTLTADRPYSTEGRPQ
jgi:hypothetical protein